METLNAISPLDGRYYNKVNELSKYFSEKALIQYRLKIEVEYFIALSKFSLVPSNSRVTSPMVSVIFALLIFGIISYFFAIV